MTKYGTKALLAVVAVVLILGLATSGFAQGKWVFGIKGDMTFVEPFQEGGDFSEKWNDDVDSLNGWLGLEAYFVELMGGTAVINPAEKITRGYSAHAYLERRMSQIFGIRMSVDYLTGMSSTYGLTVTNFWDTWWLDWMDGVEESETSASAIWIGIAPRLIVPMGNFELNFGAGPFYCLANASLSEKGELVGDFLGELYSMSSQTSLAGSKIGYYGDIELKMIFNTMAINVEAGYQSTGKIDVAGQGTAAGEDFGVPWEDTWDTEGVLDFSGFYVAVSLEFSF